MQHSEIITYLLVVFILLVQNQYTYSNYIDQKSDKKINVFEKNNNDYCSNFWFWFINIKATVLVDNFLHLFIYYSHFIITFIFNSEYSEILSNYI